MAKNSSITCSVNQPNASLRLPTVLRSRCTPESTLLLKSGASKTSNQCASDTQTWRARWKKSNHSSKNGPASKSRNHCSLVVCRTCCDYWLGAHCSDRCREFSAQRPLQSQLLSRVDLRGPLLAVAWQ